MTSVRVLVVDDSAYLRKSVTTMLSTDSRVSVVGVARTGREALERVRELRPDVVTLDLMMPELDGIGFLREQMASWPLPVVVVSSLDEQANDVLAALDAGAVDFVQKPTALANEKLYDMARNLIEKVLAAAAIPSSRVGRVGRGGVTPRAWHPTMRRVVDAVVMGLSTGGPQALRSLVPSLPRDIPVPLALVLHMPVGYTRPLAEKLQEGAEVEVVEAEEGMEMLAGRLIVARAGRQMKLRQKAGNVVVHLDELPKDTPHVPSVDVLFRSAAEAYGSRLLGIVLTGMGNDGTEGAGWIKASGGMVYAESEDSALIYGMPRSIVEAGLADRTVPLQDVSDAILSLL